MKNKTLKTIDGINCLLVGIMPFGILLNKFSHKVIFFIVGMIFVYLFHLFRQGIKNRILESEAKKIFLGI